MPAYATLLAPLNDTMAIAVFQRSQNSRGESGKGNNRALSCRSTSIQLLPTTSVNLRLYPSLVFQRKAVSAVAHFLTFTSACTGAVLKHHSTKRFPFHHLFTLAVSPNAFMRVSSPTFSALSVNSFTAESWRN